MGKQNYRIQLFFIVISITLLIGIQAGNCEDFRLSKAKLETSVGTFILESKLVKKGNGFMVVSYPEYSIVVKKDNRAIEFYADEGYYPRMLPNSEKEWSDEEILIGIFINFAHKAYKATFNYEDFLKTECQRPRKLSSLVNNDLQKDCKERYEQCQLNLTKMKTLLNNATDFSSKLEALYNDVLIRSKRMRMVLF